MEIPTKYNIWIDKPGRLNYFIRWIGYRIRNSAMYVSFWGQELVNRGRVEKTREIDIKSLINNHK